MPMKTLGMTEPRPYKVACRVILDSEFLVDATSEEDAQDVVMSYVQDGEYGTITDTDIAVEEVFPVDELGGVTYRE